MFKNLSYTILKYVSNDQSGWRAHRLSARKQNLNDNYPTRRGSLEFRWIGIDKSEFSLDITRKNVTLSFST